MITEIRGVYQLWLQSGSTFKSAMIEAKRVVQVARKGVDEKMRRTLVENFKQNKKNVLEGGDEVEDGRKKRNRYTKRMMEENC